MAPGGGSDGTQTCRSRRHDGSPRSPAVLAQLQLCAACRDRLENDLLGLPTWYENGVDCSDHREHRPLERVSNWTPRRTAVSDALVTIRSDLLSTLASWSGMVAAERGVIAPNQLDVRQLATFLAIHFTWLTAHPAAPDLVDELTALTQAARSVVVPHDSVRVEVGRCDQPSCGRSVYAERYGVEDQIPYWVGCDAGHTWPPDRWTLLRDRPGWSRHQGDRDQPQRSDEAE